MRNETHPDIEALHLWQTGELAPREQRDVDTHLAYCAECCKILAGFDALYDEARWADDAAAAGSIRVRLANHTRRERWIRVSASGAIAAGLMVAVLLYSTDLTPSARAETLLHRAVARENSAAFQPHILRIHSDKQSCHVIWARAGKALLETASEDTACAAIEQHLQSAGWDWNAPLSARGFERWRASLRHKQDQVQKTQDTTELRTSTDEGPIREAMLRVRNADDEAIAARVQLASDSLIEMDAEPDSPAEVTAHINAVLDQSEAQARLALHRIGADTNALLAIEQLPESVRVWGVVPNAATKASITQALSTVPNVSVAVRTEAEQQAAPTPLPWQAAHGTELPLLYDPVNALFRNDPDGRQALLNDLDTLTRRMVGEARSRDALLALAARAESSTEKAPLHRAAIELGNRLLADQRQLQQRLQPVVAGLPSKPLQPLSYRQAENLYRLTHRLFFANDDKDKETTEATLAEVAKLPL